MFIYCSACLSDSCGPYRCLKFGFVFSSDDIVPPRDSRTISLCFTVLLPNLMRSLSASWAIVRVRITNLLVECFVEIFEGANAFLPSMSTTKTRSVSLQNASLKAEPTGIQTMLVDVYVLSWMTFGPHILATYWLQT